MQSFFNAQGEDLHEAKYSNKGNLKIPKFFRVGGRVRMHGENMQTQCRKTPGWDLNSGP